MNHTPKITFDGCGLNDLHDPFRRRLFTARTDNWKELREIGIYIETACNAHEELVKSLKEMTTILSAIQNTLTGYLTPDSTLDQDDCINAILNISDHKETLSKQRSALQLLTTIEKGA